MSDGLDTSDLCPTLRPRPIQRYPYLAPLYDMAVVHSATGKNPRPRLPTKSRQALHCACLFAYVFHVFNTPLVPSLASG